MPVWRGQLPKGAFCPSTVRSPPHADPGPDGPPSCAHMQFHRAPHRIPTPALPFCRVTLRGRKPRDPAYPDELRALGDHIRKRRLDLGLLQREVAQEIGVTVFTIRNWERGRAEPAVRCLPGIISFLGYNPLLPLANTLGERITADRRGHGLSRDVFAALLDVNSSTLWRWETDQAVPRGERRRRLEVTLKAPRPETTPGRS